ncbi:MAG TPA: phosphosugar isomerase, partial [Phycicoccus sp.]|nr:phosphosugar isomerase [Phycicoccus sp.]
MAFLEDAALDDVEALARLDCSDSLLALARSGAQVRRAVVAAQESGIERVASGERPRAVLLAALGGSSVVGEVLDLLTEPSSPVPVTTRRDGPLPGWVGPLDLVIAVSQSGYAVGPVALAAEAARRGASLLTVGAADSPLAEACARGR